MLRQQTISQGKDLVKTVVVFVHRTKLLGGVLPRVVSSQVDPVVSTMSTPPPPTPLPNTWLRSRDESGRYAMSFKWRCGTTFLFNLGRHRRVISLDTRTEIPPGRKVYLRRGTVQTDQVRDLWDHTSFRVSTCRYSFNIDGTHDNEERMDGVEAFYKSRWGS